MATESEKEIEYEVTKSNKLSNRFEKNIREYFKIAVQHEKQLQIKTWEDKEPDDCACLSLGAAYIGQYKTRLEFALKHFEQMVNLEISTKNLNRDENPKAFEAIKEKRKLCMKLIEYCRGIISERITVDGKGQWKQTEDMNQLFIDLDVNYDKMRNVVDAAYLKNTMKPFKPKLYPLKWKELWYVQWKSEANKIINIDKNLSRQEIWGKALQELVSYEKNNSETNLKTFINPDDLETMDSNDRIQEMKNFVQSLRDGVEYCNNCSRFMTVAQRELNPGLIRDLETGKLSETANKKSQIDELKKSRKKFWENGNNLGSKSIMEIAKNVLMNRTDTLDYALSYPGKIRNLTKLTYAKVASTGNTNGKNIRHFNKR